MPGLIRATCYALSLKFPWRSIATQINSQNRGLSQNLSRRDIR
jgi:hypothetical protein